MITEVPYRWRRLLGRGDAPVCYVIYNLSYGILLLLLLVLLLSSLLLLIYYMLYD